MRKCGQDVATTLLKPFTFLGEIGSNFQLVTVDHCAIRLFDYELYY